MNLLNTATTYHQSGLKVIPFWKKQNGKVSFPNGYGKYRSQQTEQDIRQLFSASVDGIALLCTDGIEAIDIDVKHDPKKTITSEFLEYVKLYDESKEAVDCSVLQRTKNDGFHIIYRTNKPGPNSKLAKRPGCKEQCIETRGQGGLLFIHPTPGYKLISGDFLNIPLIDDEGRDKLIECAKQLDCPDPEPVLQKMIPRPQIQEDEKTPWDDYNEQHDVLDLVEAYGWKQVGRLGDYIRMNRPGAVHPKAVDATIIANANLFYPFTTSSEFPSEKSYTPFAVYAIMEHKGNYTKAARELAHQGFGTKPNQNKEKQEAVVDELLQKAIDTRFDFHAPIKKEKTILKHTKDGKIMDVAGFGQIGVFIGHEKSGKSFVGSCIASSALAKGVRKIGFQLDLMGKKMLWFDTEQSSYFYHYTQKRIHQLADVRDNVDYYEAYHLRRFNVDERLAVIKHLVYNTPDVGCVMVDGFVDLIKDYNSLEEAQKTVGEFMKWTDEIGFLMLGVLHVNKGDGKIRGHLGSEIKNKCDFVINVKQDAPGYYEVSNPTARYKAFQSFTFTRDDNGMPIMEDDFEETF